MSFNSVSNYSVANSGILTYFIPRVHVSVDEGFLREQLEQFWFRNVCESSGHDVAQNQIHHIVRVDFVPYANDLSFNKVFVYHSPAACGMTNEVIYQTAKIFNAEKRKAPLRCNFFHRGKNSYWLLLPNLNPLTMKQKQMAETIAELQDEIVDNLSRLCEGSLPVPTNFDASVLEHKHIETAFCRSLTEIDNDFKTRIGELREQKRLIELTLNKAFVPTAEDEAHMEQLAREEEEECNQAREDDEEEAIINETRNMWCADNNW